MGIGNWELGIPERKAVIVFHNELEVRADLLATVEGRLDCVLFVSKIVLLVEGLDHLVKEQIGQFHLFDPRRVVDSLACHHKLIKSSQIPQIAFAREQLVGLIHERPILLPIGFLLHMALLLLRKWILLLLLVGHPVGKELAQLVVDFHQFLSLHEEHQTHQAQHQEKK